MQCTTSTLLQVEQPVLQQCTWFSVDMFTHLVSQLVSILTGSWYPHCAWPVVVHVGQLVRDPLHKTSLDG